ncbi:MAG: hypothetical protein H0V42_10245, partial [Nocardioidaceae bacterium]|nr:hypothetical protein [Nocardioidaceae bacterium]
RDRARRTLHHHIDRADNDLGHRLARVRGLSPLATLKRGYSVVQDADGHVVSSAAETSVGSALDIRTADGRIAARVTGRTEHETTDHHQADRSSATARRDASTATQEQRDG